jgi:tRNA pseudouridine13 synthase
MLREMIIRRTPQDFRVIERLAGGLVRSEGSHAVYEVEKTSLTTPEASQRLASQLKLKANKVEYAGLKDKHAVTLQAMSVEGFEEAPERLEAPGFRARLLGFLDRHLVAADIECNLFEITVRDATREQCRSMDRRGEAVLLDESGTLGFVNYFGEQRMGSNRHGAGFVARRLVEGDFEGALRLAIGTPARKDTGARRELTRALAMHWGEWKRIVRTVPGCPQRAAVEALEAGASWKEAYAALPHFDQQMHVEAFQSHLWNAVAAALVRSLPPDDLIPSTDAAHDGMVFPTAAHWTSERRGLQVPMLCETTRLEGAWGRAARDVLAAEDLTIDRLRIPGLRRPAFSEAARPLFAAASGATVTAAEPDDLGRTGRLKRTLRFSLPRGAYATVLLRALGQ